ncbi:MAG TPA: response regulator [Haliangiales bacterium]|nr:response regulator [Haliangiales bacterium]
MNSQRILLLEDAFVTSVAMGRALEVQLPDCVVMRAQSLYEARVLLKTYDFHFFVVDIQLPDGCGIDFLPEIAARNPGAGVAIVTAMPLPKYRQQASDFGVLHFMEKPVDVRLLARRIASHLQGAEPPSSEPSSASSFDTSFAASLQHLSALDVIQLKCLARASVRLDFTAPEGTLGRIHLTDGEIVHAEVIPPSGAGCKEGFAAFNEILSWRGGRVDETQRARPSRITIQGDWQSLVLNAFQSIEERRNRNGLPPDNGVPV